MTADNEMNLQRVAESPDPIAGTHSFRKTLRSRAPGVGQALEARHVFSLDLELKGGLYVVRGKVSAADYAQSSFSGFIQDFVSGVDRFSRAVLARRPTKSICPTNRRTSKNLTQIARIGAMETGILIPTAWHRNYAGQARFWIIGPKRPLPEYRLKIGG